MKKHVCVLGACNYDLVGRCFTAYRAGDASEGTIRLQPGGVGRNLAQGIWKMGHEVDFISVLGEDLFGQELEKELQGQEFTFHKISRNQSDVFLGLEDLQGELYGSLADMRGIESLSLSEVPLSLLEDAQVLVLDCCLSQAFLEELFTHFPHKKIFVDGVSVDRVGRILPFLKHVHLLKVNLAEARALTGEHGEEDIIKKLLELGLHAVLLSLGPRGIRYEDREICLQKKEEAHELLSTLGAGDALFSALIGALLDEFPIEAAIEKGLDSAVETLNHFGSWKG